MKKNTLLIMLNFIFFCVKAQDTIPNANFEQSTYYTDAGNITHIHTNFWKHSDGTAIWLDKYERNIFKPFEGYYSADIISNSAGDPTYLYQKFPYSERPKTFTMQVFFYHNSNSERHCVEIIFEKNNSQISYNKTLSESIYYNNYKDTSSFCYPYLMAVPLVFPTNDTPDYCTIKIWSANCEKGSYHLPGDRVIIDDLKFHQDSVVSSKYVNSSISEPAKNNSSNKALEKFPLKLIPNPAGQFCMLNYSLKETKQIQIAIYDAHGKLVKSILNQKQAYGDYNINIETANLAEGIYFVMVRSDGNLASDRLVIQH